MKLSRTIALVLAGTALVGGVAALAAQGSQSDPLVTLSYLDQIVTPSLTSAVDDAVSANAQELQKQLDLAVTSYENRVDEKLAAAGTVFTSKSLSKGDKFTLSAGRELLVVTGSAKAVGSLADTTAGTVIASGTDLTPGHLYVTVSEDGGLEATGAVTVMTR